MGLRDGSVNKGLVPGAQSTLQHPGEKLDIVSVWGLVTVRGTVEVWCLV